MASTLSFKLMQLILECTKKVVDCEPQLSSPASAAMMMHFGTAMQFHDLQDNQMCNMTCIYETQLLC